MNLTDPIAKLAAGPVHFAYTGWAFVDILPESKPSADENFYLIYHHPYSFEADSWLRAKEISDTPVCIMNAGYSSGWCEESFGLPLTAVEVTCKARGDKNCTFIMSPPHKIKQHLKKYSAKSYNPDQKKSSYEIPAFFERRKMEEQLSLYALIVESTADAIFSTTLEGIITSWNRGAKKLFGYSKTEIIGKHVSLLLPAAQMHEEAEITEQIKKGEAIIQFETERLTKKGKPFPVSLTASGIKDTSGHIIGISQIGHDISKRRKAELALKDLNNSLELLVQQRTADLQRSYDELETRVAFRNLELEKANKASLTKIKALEKKVAELTRNK
jgi:PAS domain S-box-containing protein